MKINEISQPNTNNQLDEDLASALFGDVPVAALKGLFTGTNTKHQLAQSIFLKDFYSDATISLSNGISSGLVDPSLQGDLSTQGGNDEDPPAADPASPASSSAAVPTTSPTQVPPAQQTGQTMSNQQTSTAKMQTRAGIQPTGQPMTAAQRTQAQIQARKMKAAQKPVPLKPKTTESKFAKLNSIFESIIEADQANTAESISEYMLDWFSQYMTGVNWESRKAKVLPLIQSIESTYQKDKGKAAIKKLAQFALAMSGPSKTFPAGAKNAVDNVRQAAAPASQPTDPDQLLAGMANLKKTKPYDYQKVQKKLDELPK